MKTLLIVEDEKMIRQGIRTMVQRSGVPVDVILECSNGLMALEVLKEQHVDVMFTDIRMPKMDGIALVRAVQELEHVPEIVAISGFDDFTYAVEMLRNGVREYILKPVERDKIVEVLTMLESELNERMQRDITEQKMGIAQIKHVLTGQASKEEVDFLLDKYEDQFFPGGYYVCAAGKGFASELKSGSIFINDMKEVNLLIIETEKLLETERTEMVQQSVGISLEHHGIREIKEAYFEAMNARKRAFYRGGQVVRYAEPVTRIPEGLMQQERRHVDAEAWTKRLHLIGTDRTEDLDVHWNGLFEAVKRGHVRVEDFEEGMAGFLKDFANLYRSLIHEEEEKRIQKLGYMYSFDNVEDYRDALMNLVFQIHDAINEKADDSRNQQKIKQAIAYIEANFDKDLNMAVVSNEISMNYSLFSYVFKQYTGSNFVNYLRDIRVKEAKRLLKDTDMKVVDISQCIGYDNEKHFMKVFKTCTGVSPSEYRKNTAQR